MSGSGAIPQMKANCGLCSMTQCHELRGSNRLIP